MDKELKLRDFLKAQVSPIFERLIVDMLIENPEDVVTKHSIQVLFFQVEYAIQWLGDKGKKLQRGEKVPRQKSSKKPSIAIQETPNYDFNPVALGYEPAVDSEEEEHDDEQYDEEEFADHYKKSAGVPMRQSVSAEAYGKFHKKEDFVARVIQKSDDQKQRIKTRLMQCFMFSELNDKDKNIVIDAMEEKRFKKDDKVIKQGDDGEVLYLVDSGKLDCYRRMNKTDKEDKFLKSYGPGDAFGELALLYNAPRAATIIAHGDAICFALDRATFNNIVKEGSVKKRERYEATLKKVDLLSSMDPYERTHLCDGLKELIVKAGETVIKEGEKGDKFYMVDEGILEALKVLSEGEPPQKVMDYHDGAYFGELALIKDIPRQATVRAVTDSILVYLDYGTFKRLMGPMEDLLKRNADKYETYWKAKDNLEDLEHKRLSHQ